MTPLPPVPPIRGPQLPRDAIKNLITTLTVTSWAPTGWSVIWSTEQEPFEGIRNDTLGAWIELGISAYRSLGQDDYRQQFNATTNAFESAYYGLRMFTLTIDVRSFDSDVPAWDVIESIRLRLNNARSVTARALLQAVNLAVVRIHPSQSLNYVERGDIDNRMIWRQVMDIEFTWLSAAQVTDDPGAWIQTVDGGGTIPGTIYDPSGNPWPSPANPSGFTGVPGWILAMPGNIEPGRPR